MITQTKTKDADIVFNYALGFQYIPLERRLLAVLNTENILLYKKCSTARKIAILDKFAARLGL